MNSLPQTAESTSPLSRRPRAIAVAILLAVIAAGLAWWLRGGGQATAEEAAAKAELTKLGALLVPDSFERAIALLPALGQLRSLNVDGTQFGDAHAATVGQLGSLQDLVLSNTAITDAALDKLGSLTQLKTLYVVNTGVTNAGMPLIGRLRSLRIVDISGTKVTGGLEPLRQLGDLNWLVAQRLTLDAPAIGAIGECQGLSRLSLRETTCPAEALSELEQKRPEMAIDR
jgi:internalin A